MITIGYIRPSPGYLLSAHEQRAAIAELARREGLTLNRIYADGTDRDAAGLPALLRSIEEGRVSTVVTASICRLGATWPRLLRVLATMAGARVTVFVVDRASQHDAEALIRAVPAIVGVRSALHREAAAAGRARAKARGVRFGRPRIPDAKIARVREALETGVGVREAARRAGVSPASVLRVSRSGSYVSGTHTEA